MFTRTLISLALCASTFAHSGAHEKRAPAKVITRCTKPNSIAVTFDDGPYIYEGDIVDMLKQYGAKATFFVNGKNYKCIYDDDMVKLLRKTYAAGHQIASHTWEHKHLSTLSWDAVHHQMWKTEEALQKILGVSPAFMRPPYGEYNDLVKNASGLRNQSLVIWDFDSGDSSGASIAQVEDNFEELAKKRPSSILSLQHETVEATAHHSLMNALAAFKDKGYKFVTVAECVGQQPYKSSGTTYSQGNRDSTWHC